MAINSFTASGNVGNDCEVRYTNNGKCIAQFSLPVRQGYGEHQKTSWVTCKMFGGMAESLGSIICKGMKVTVSGEFVIEKWTGNDGNERQTVVILVRDIDLPSRNDSQQQGQSHQGQRHNQNHSGQSHQQQGGWGHPQQRQQSAEPPMDFDDDIPF